MRNDAKRWLFAVALAIAPASSLAAQEANGLTGYLNVGLNAPPASFQYGFSLYSVIFDRIPDPASGTQLGATTWILPDNRTFTQALCPVGTYARDHWPERGPTYRDVYQTIEGGVGQSTTTRFPTSSPKYRINGTPDCYTTEISKPGWTFSGTRLPSDKLGLAQLSNRLLLPADGIPFIGANVASVLGYGWFALPLIPAYTSPAGVATGDQSWALFFNTANFKGPVAFYTPETWSRVNMTDSIGLGRGHDARPAYVGAVALEIGNTPMFTASDAAGVRYRRIPRLTFAASSAREAILIQDVRYYSKQAIWDGVAGWMQGGAAASRIEPAAVFEPTFSGFANAVTLGGAPVAFDTAQFYGGPLKTSAGGNAIGFRWGSQFDAGSYPEYFREEAGTWKAIPSSSVPAQTGLAGQSFSRPTTSAFPDLDTSAASPWTSTRWKAGPFSVALSDGSMVDYVWYRFIDQPAITRLGLSTQALNALQVFAESLHARSGLDGLTFAGPSSGTLATMDSALFVTPPAGLEKGYVPIAIRQYPASVAPAQNFTDLWWNPAESGWGLSISQHGTAVFAAWYIYDDSGRPTWIVMPGGQWTTSTTYAGDLYTTTGPDPIAGPFNPAAVTPTRAGTATLNFTANDRALLSYRVGSVAGSRGIERQRFGPLAADATRTPNYGDLWWNASESGWGISITQQNNSLFAAWYAYGAGNKPTWYVMPSGGWASADTWTGPLYRTAALAAPFLSGSFNPSSVQASAVGDLTLRFTDTNSATMTYSVDGISGTKAITRQPF